MHELWIASNNPKKRRELERLLGDLPGGVAVRLRTPEELGVPFDPIEDQPDFAGNAAKKARELARLSGGVALADDSGLCVDALDGRPGVHSARYGGPGLDDAERVQRLLRELASVPEELRTASFCCHLCLCGPDGQVRWLVEDRCHGVLLEAPRGEDGFGYDPIFVPQTHARTGDPRSFAELSPVEKDRLSHRGKALRALRQAIADDPGLLAP